MIPSLPRCTTCGRRVAYSTRGGLIGHQYRTELPTGQLVWIPCPNPTTARQKVVLR